MESGIFEIESESKIVAAETYEEMLARNLDAAVVKLEEMKKRAAEERIAPLHENAAAWYSGESQETVVKRGYQCIENGTDWRLVIPEDRGDKFLTAEAKFWLDFQEANYDVITRAGSVLAAGVYGEDKEICDRCFDSVCNAIDKVEVNLHEDWQSFVPFALLEETMSSEGIINPESVEGFSRVVSLAAQKVPDFFLPKIKINSDLTVDGYKSTIKSLDVISAMVENGRDELSAAMVQVRDSLPQRNPVTVTVGRDALPAKEDSTTSPEQLVEVREKSDKNSSDDSCVTTVMHAVVPDEVQPNQAEVPQVNIAVSCITGLCRGFMRILGCR